MVKDMQFYKQMFPHSAIVPVIASFDTQGHIRPLYVRIAGEPLRVESSWVKPSFENTTVFNCQLEDHGQLKPLELTLHHREGIWLAPSASVSFFFPQDP